MVRLKESNEGDTREYGISCEGKAEDCSYGFIFCPGKMAKASSSKVKIFCQFS
jgi:hypothetical protein